MHKIKKNVKNRIRELITDIDFNNKYCVKDILSENVKIIFLLESPHNEEVKCKYPLAGKSGVNMTKFFCKVFNLSGPKCCDKIVPFGKLVKDAHNSKITDNDFINKLKKIGIMNVCNIPMQMQVYCCDDIRKYCEILRILDFLRNRANFKNRIGDNKKEKNKIQKIIKVSLCNKIKNFKNVLFVPMGNLALAYIQECNSSLNSNIFEVDSKPVSHPSPRNFEWNKIEKLDTLNPKILLDYLGVQIKKIIEEE